MRDLLDVVARHRRGRARGETMALATVVRVEGSAYRRPGACAVIVGAEVTGMVSGGCLEADLALRAEGLGAPTLVTYSLADDDLDSVGLGCGGTVTILLEPLVDAVDAVDLLAAALDDLEPTVVAVSLEGPRLGERKILRAPSRLPFHGSAAEVARTGRPRRLVDPEVVLFRVPRRPRLVVCGAGGDSVPLVRIADELGFHVTVFDRRPARLAHAGLATAERRLVPIDALPAALADLAPETFVVVMNHHLEADRAALAGLARASVRYVGVLGPRERTHGLLAEVGTIPGLHAPTGLDIGAEGPEAIALAILAEIQAVRSGRLGGMLRHRVGPIHERCA